MAPHDTTFVSTIRSYTQERFMKKRNLEAPQAPREYGWKLLLSHGRGVHLQQDVEVDSKK